MLYRGEPVADLTSQPLRSLLAYLVLHPESAHPRQQLAYLLWPASSESQARTNLRKWLHLLRRALPDSDQFLDVSSRAIRWRSDAPFALDVASFEMLTKSATQAQERDELATAKSTLEQALALYQGDLLPGWYEDWVLARREALQQKLVQSLDQLGHLSEAEGDYQAAIAHAQHLLHVDPLYEAAYRNLMRLFAQTGDRTHALRAYQTCADILMRELGVEPDAPTTSLYESLLKTETVPQAGMVDKNFDHHNDAFPDGDAPGQVRPPVAGSLPHRGSSLKWAAGLILILLIVGLVFGGIWQSALFQNNSRSTNLTESVTSSSPSLVAAGPTATETATNPQPTPTASPARTATVDHAATRQAQTDLTETAQVWVQGTVEAAVAQTVQAGATTRALYQRSQATLSAATSTGQAEAAEASTAVAAQTAQANATATALIQATRLFQNRAAATAQARATQTAQAALLPAPRDFPIPLGTLANDNIHALFRNLPIGDQIYGGVLFQIPDRNNKVGTQCARFADWPTEIFLPVGNIEHPQSVHLLVNAGYTRDYVEGLQIGTVELHFAGGQSYSFNLKLGENIREWRFEGMPVVPLTSPDVIEVYRQYSEAERTEVLDMLTIPIPDSYQASALQYLVVKDTSREVTGSGDPCFYFVGLTVKARQ